MSLELANRMNIMHKVIARPLVYHAYNAGLKGTCAASNAVLVCAQGVANAVHAKA